jgi:hypothetical protein
MLIIKLEALQINVDGTARNAACYAFQAQAMFFEYLETRIGLKVRDAFRSVNMMNLTTTL